MEDRHHVIPEPRSTVGRSRRTGVAIAAAAALVLPAALGGCSSSSKSTSTTSTTASAAATTSASPTTTGAGPVAARIKGFAFNPSKLQVKVGETVTWTNADTVAHTVSELNGPQKFDSGHVTPGKSFSFTFTKRGQYQYICGIHNFMSGTVTVS